MALTPSYFMDPKLWMRWQLVESILKTWREESGSKTVAAHDYLRQAIPHQVVQAGKFRENYIEKLTRWRGQITAELAARGKLGDGGDYVTLDAIFSHLTGTEEQHRAVHRSVFLAATNSMAKYMVQVPRDTEGKPQKPMNQRYKAGFNPERDL